MQALQEVYETHDLNDSLYNNPESVHNLKFKNINQIIML